VLAVPVSGRLESGDGFELGVSPAGERLEAPFEIVDGVVIPPGSYDWVRYNIALRSAAKQTRPGANGRSGSFYGGRSTRSARGLVDALAVRHAPSSSGAEHRPLPHGDFDVTIVGSRVRLNLSPDLQLNSFLQYDTEDRSFGTNALRWTFSPRGDLFVIYNHNLREIEDRWRRDANELLVKLQYTFRR
jgi:hypothetical protein